MLGSKTKVWEVRINSAEYNVTARTFKEAAAKAEKILKGLDLGDFADKPRIKGVILLCDLDG